MPLGAVGVEQGLPVKAEMKKHSRRETLPGAEQDGAHSETEASTLLS